MKIDFPQRISEKCIMSCCSLLPVRVRSDSGVEAFRFMAENLDSSFRCAPLGMTNMTSGGNRLGFSDILSVGRPKQEAWIVNRVVTKLGMRLAILASLVAFTPTALAHGGTHGDERQPPAKEQSQTPQPDGSPMSAPTASDLETEEPAAEDSQLTSDIQSTSETADSIIGVGEAVLALLVVAPFLMVWAKQRLQAR